MYDAVVLSADHIIELLDLVPHPEGGAYRETWRHRGDDGGRGAGTAIYFLLRGGEDHRWHRVDAAEIWHHYAGAPLAVWLAAPDGGAATRHLLGDDLRAGQRPQVVVPPGHWQRAECLGEVTLVGCTVSPAFEFERFELAPPGWAPAPAPAAR